MAVKDRERIGVCKVGKNGNIIELQREFFRQGWVFKDWEAFHNMPDMPCYVPELDDAVYTGNDFIVLCNDQEEIAERLFHEVDWQSPYTLMDEWERTGELDTCKNCGKLFMSYDIKKCPHCGNGIPEEQCFQG